MMHEGLKFDVEEAEERFHRQARKKMVTTRSTFRLRIRMPITGWQFMIYATRPLNCLTMGLSNLTLDGKFVPFFDIDSCFLYRARQEMRRIQKEFRLGTLMLLASSLSWDDQGKEYGNFHCMGVSRLDSLQEHIDMLNTSIVDKHFRTISDSFNGKYFVLRLLPKVDKHGREVSPRPVLREVLTAKTERKISTGHLKFLQSYYHFPELGDCKQDGYNWVKLVKYPSTVGRWRSDILPKSDVLINKVLKHFSKGDNHVSNIGAGQ